MDEDFPQKFATIIERCIAENGMQPPLVVCTVSTNGSVVVTRVNAGGEPDVLAEHSENQTFAFPINIMVVSQNNKAARVVIERGGNIGRFH
jgi:hypothetical protein